MVFLRVGTSQKRQKKLFIQEMEENASVVVVLKIWNMTISLHILVVEIVMSQTFNYFVKSVIVANLIVVIVKYTIKK